MSWLSDSEYPAAKLLTTSQRAFGAVLKVHLFLQYLTLEWLCTGIHGSWTSTYLGPPEDFRPTTYNIKAGVSANGRPKYAK